MEKKKDDAQRENLKRQGMNKEEIEDIVYYDRKKKQEEEKLKEMKIRYKSKNYQEYKKRYSKAFKSAPVKKSSM